MELSLVTKHLHKKNLRLILNRREVKDAQINEREVRKAQESRREVTTSLQLSITVQILTTIKYKSQLLVHRHSLHIDTVDCNKWWI